MLKVWCAVACCGIEKRGAAHPHPASIACHPSRCADCKTTTKDSNQDLRIKPCIIPRLRRDSDSGAPCYSKPNSSKCSDYPCKLGSNTSRLSKAEQPDETASPYEPLAYATSEVALSWAV